MMARTVHTLLIGLLLSLGLVPAAAAHEDGCLIAEHVGSASVHWVCTSNPETCAWNAKHQGVEANIGCRDPGPVPCAAKLTAADQHVKICANSV